MQQLYFALQIKICQGDAFINSNLNIEKLGDPSYLYYNSLVEFLKKSAR